LALVLAGPFALLITFVVVLAVAPALVGLIGATLAAPYLLARHLRADREARTRVRAPSSPFVAGRSRWGTA
jgi:hypothetical protein